MLIWWMYALYEWLTNEAGAQRPMRLMLIAAMPGFLVMALALPNIFGTDRLTFGLAYLFVVILHLVAFFIKGGQNALWALLLFCPWVVPLARCGEATLPSLWQQCWSLYFS
jgi:low temperature requirement protein LtrA